MLRINIWRIQGVIEVTDDYDKTKSQTCNIVHLINVFFPVSNAIFEALINVHKHIEEIPWHYS